MPERADASGGSDLGPARGGERVAVVMGRIVERAIELIPRADGATVEIAEGDTLTYVAAAGTLVPYVGIRLDLWSSLSGRAVRDDVTLRCDDTETDPRVDREACRRVGSASMVCVPLRRGARPIGVLKVSARVPGAFTARDVAILSQLGEFVTACITAARDVSRSASAVLAFDCDELAPGDRSGISSFVAHVVDPAAAATADAAERVEQVLAGEMLTVELQPIVELSGMELVGAEALSRIPLPPSRPPDQWFAEARRAGLGVPLQRLAVRRAVDSATSLPQPAYLAVNLDSEGLCDDTILETLVHSPRPLVVELTEQVEVADADELHQALVFLRQTGARLAIDDTGAGYASLSRLVKLAPELIKLDAELVRGIALDPVRRSLVTAVVAFARETGAQVVAEGIESRDELAVVRDLGVGYGQGFLLGRPAPPGLVGLEQVGLQEALGR